MVDARSRFAARLEAGDVGLEAWTLVAVRGEEIFLVQHALELGPQRREGTVRALLLRGGGARRREARVQRAVVDPGRALALWDAHSLSAAETYGGAGDWRWRLRSSDEGSGLGLPPLLDALSDVWLSAPAARLAVSGELALAGEWAPFAAPACLVHRACSEGCGAWAWLALPGLGGLVAAQTRLPALPLSVSIGRQQAPWPLRLGECLRREEGGWRLSLPGGRELGLLERSRLTLARGLSGTVFLACVEAGGTGQRGWGVLESFEPGAV